jgi:hypothetical protein
MNAAIAAPRPLSSEMYSDSFMLRSVASCYVEHKHQATEKNSKMLRMKTIAEIRYDNLQKLVEELGGGDLTKMLEKSKSWSLEESENKLSRATLYQILERKLTNNGAVRNVGDELARKIESELRLENGWMDNIHTGKNETPGMSFDPSYVATMVLTFFQTDELGRKGIVSAVEAARTRGLSSTADQLKGGGR